MRDQDIRELLQGLPGSPASKDRAIREIRRRQGTAHMSLPGILLIQFRYIRKRVWIASLLIVILSLTVTVDLSFDRLTAVSDLMPFLAGLGMLEALRADMHGMRELESVTLISAKGALYARAALIGAAHLITMLVSSVFLLPFASDITTAAAMLLIPYISTSILCMEAERTRFGRENGYCCLVIAFLVFGTFRIMLHSNISSGVTPGTLLIIITALIALEIYELKKTLRSEEYAWN